MAYVKYDDFDIELGGFAENPEDVDDSYEDFNRCLADEYLIAINKEDFKALGELSHDLLLQIRRWAYDIDGTDKILDGSIKTDKDRTFISAIIDNHAYKAGEAYCNCNNPKYIAMMIECSDSYDTQFYYDPHDDLNEEEWNKLIQDVFVELNKTYLLLDEVGKEKLLERVKSASYNARSPKNFHMEPIHKSELTKQLVKKNN